MNIIANDCVGGELYRLCDEEFKSPFMWTILPFKDFLELYKNYDDIDFKNIKYRETPNYYFSWYMSSLVIDDRVNVYFPHHSRDWKYEEFTKYEPIKGQSMCAWNQMDKYIIEHYNNRVERMIEKPCFVYSQENRNTEEQLKRLVDVSFYNKYHLIFITSDNNLIKEYSTKTNNVRWLLKSKNEVIQKKQAEAIKNNFIDFVNYK